MYSLTVKIRLGRPGVDSHVHHETDAAVLQITFLMNEGALVTATADDSLHLWNFRQKKPEVVHSLKFQRERYFILIYLLYNYFTLFEFMCHRY